MVDLPINKKLEILEMRADGKSQEETAESTRHSKKTVGEVERWLRALPWEQVRGLPERVQRLRPDYLEMKAEELREKEAILQLALPEVAVYADNRGRQGRYATLQVRNLGRAVARNCRGRLDMLKGLRASFPLHWAGTDYTVEEFSAPTVDIQPNIPARLDVAFALPPSPPAILPQAITSGQISSLDIKPEMWPPYAPGQGCWVAQPLALSQPNPKLTAHLPPGVYRVRVAVGCDNMAREACRDLVLVSPDSWEGLALQPT